MATYHYNPYSDNSPRVYVGRGHTNQDSVPPTTPLQVTPTTPLQVDSVPLTTPLSVTTTHATQDDGSYESSVLLQPDGLSSVPSPIPQDLAPPSLLSAIFGAFDHFVLGQGGASAAAILSSAPLLGQQLFIGQLKQGLTPHDLAAIMVRFARIKGPVHVVMHETSAHVTFFHSHDATKVFYLKNRIVFDERRAYYAGSDEEYAFMREFMEKHRPNFRGECDLPMYPMSVLPPSNAKRNKKRLNESPTDPAARRPHGT